MSAPAGWYPDPDPNQPAGSRRYWDGSAWTEQTMTPQPEFPETQPVTPAQPPAAPGSGQDGWGQNSWAAGTGQSGSWQGTGQQAGQDNPWGPTQASPSSSSGVPENAPPAGPGAWQAGAMHGNQSTWQTGQQGWQQGQPGQQGQPWQPGPYDPANSYDPGNQWQPTQPPRSGNRAAWIAIGAFALVALMVVVFVVAYLRNRDTSTSGANPTSGRPQACWPGKVFSDTTELGGSSVTAGRLTFPAMSAPWGAPIGDITMSAATESAGQQFVAAESYNGTSSWVGSAVVAAVRIVNQPQATPQSAASTLKDCLYNSQYGADGSPAPAATETANKALTVDGKDAWTIQSDLSLTVPGLNIKTEQFTLVVVQVAPDTLGAYYSSVPDTFTAQQQQARALVGQLKVTG